MAKITDINDKNVEWVDIGQKLLTPKMKEELLQKLGKREDNINQPKHYQGKTLELTDVYQDFFKADEVINKNIMDIIKYSIRYRTKGLILENLGKIKKLSEMCIEIEKNKTKGLKNES